MSNGMYSFGRTILKGVKYLAIFGAPLLIASLADFYPEISAMTIGSFLTMGLNWLKNKSK